MKTKKYFLITALLLAVFLVMQSIPIDADTMQQINYTIASQGKSVSPNFGKLNCLVYSLKVCFPFSF